MNLSLSLIRRVVSHPMSGFVENSERPSYLPIEASLAIMLVPGVAAAQALCSPPPPPPYHPQGQHRETSEGSHIKKGLMRLRF
jgi:hypothetical protein